MIQAARSGKQNIGEGSEAAATSSQIELRLVGVARASLGELKIDYDDFLREHDLPIWDKDDAKAMEVRRIASRKDRTNPSERQQSTAPIPYDWYRPWVESRDRETAANSILCLIHQATYLLDRQSEALERQFIEEGGYSEQLADARRQFRMQHPPASDKSDPSAPSDLPNCPRCGHPMTRRTARHGPRAGSSFWGCTNYPNCKGTRPILKKENGAD